MELATLIVSSLNRRYAGCVPLTVSSYSVYAAGLLTGFDASGHVAEEIKNASVVAARGILQSTLVTGACAFCATILFLFCTPSLDVWSTLAAPQPFVQIYALALGKGPSIFMTVLAVIGLILNTSIAIVAASRLIFAIARDGALPFLDGLVRSLRTADLPMLLPSWASLELSFCAPFFRHPWPLPRSYLLEPFVSRRETLSQMIIADR